MSDEEIWRLNLAQLKKFIIENKCKPMSCSNDENEKKLGCWYYNQSAKAKTMSHIMKIKKIHEEWIDFITNDVFSKYYT